MIHKDYIEISVDGKQKKYTIYQNKNGSRYYNRTIDGKRNRIPISDEKSPKKPSSTRKDANRKSPKKCPSDKEMIEDRCLKKCSVDQTRDPQTRRCRKIQTSLHKHKVYDFSKGTISKKAENFVINSILSCFANKEGLPKYDRKKYKFYARTEFDSNLTEFEALSNKRLIILKTKLPEDDASIIIRIFQMIYDRNFYLDEWNVTSDQVISATCNHENDRDEIGIQGAIIEEVLQKEIPKNADIFSISSISTFL